MSPPPVAPALSATDVAAIIGAREESSTRLAQEADDALHDGRDDDALGAAEACLRRDSDRPHCESVAAIALLRMDRIDEARGHVSRCLDRDAADSSCLQAAARLALHDRDLTLAGIAVWHLTQVAPDSADTYVARAQLSDLQGDRAAATRSYRQACHAGVVGACLRLGELLTTTQQ